MRKIKNFKQLIIAFLLISVIGSSVNTMAQTEEISEDGIINPAYGCKYTGSYLNSCFYGNYMITRCQSGLLTSCGYNP